MELPPYRGIAVFCAKASKVGFAAILLVMRPVFAMWTDQTVDKSLQSKVLQYQFWCERISTEHGGGVNEVHRLVDMFDIWCKIHAS